ncbi:O-antigen ligase [Pseudoalteromonas sp. BSi20652]|uniref:O-antigen ligase family protein n=1 Tax=Pseudoalteromonas sp. BSi20652 TaxID=388384 RepID=UPI001ED9049B|nr:O-antigen ligase family protein [Pseudoalteromonas sp. BSi20652]
MKNLEYVLFMITAMVIPLYFTDFRLKTGGVIIRLSDVLALFSISIFVLLLLKNKIVIKYPVGFNYICIFIVYCFFNALAQVGLTKAIIATVQWMLILFTLVVVYTSAVKNPEKFRTIFIKTLLVVCFVTLIYHLMHGQLTRYKLLGDAKYAFALTGVILLSCAYYFGDKSYLKPLFFLYPVILLSLERKGILAFHMVAFFYLFITIRPLYKFIILALCSLTALLLALFYDLSFLNSFTFFEYSDFEMLYLDEEQALWISNLHRQSLLTNGWDIFTMNPIFGVGPKMLPVYMDDYYINPKLGLYTHNVFLDTLIEQGITGLLLLLLPYLIHIIQSVSLRNKKDKVVFIALCLYSIFMLFFMSGGAPSMIIFYLAIFKGFIANKIDVQNITKME